MELALPPAVTGKGGLPCTPRESSHCSPRSPARRPRRGRSEEHTSELQSRLHLVCRLLLEKKKLIIKPLFTGAWSHHVAAYISVSVLTISSPVFSCSGVTQS